MMHDASIMSYIWKKKIRLHNQKWILLSSALCRQFAKLNKFKIACCKAISIILVTMLQIDIIAQMIHKI